MIFRNSNTSGNPQEAAIAMQQQSQVQQNHSMAESKQQHYDDSPTSVATFAEACNGTSRENDSNNGGGGSSSIEEGTAGESCSSYQRRICISGDAPCKISGDSANDSSMRTNPNQAVGRTGNRMKKTQQHQQHQLPTVDDRDKSYPTLRESNDLLFSRLLQKSEAFLSPTSDVEKLKDKSRPWIVNYIHSIISAAEETCARMSSSLATSSIPKNVEAKHTVSAVTVNPKHSHQYVKSDQEKEQQQQKRQKHQSFLLFPVALSTFGLGSPNDCTNNCTVSDTRDGDIVFSSNCSVCSEIEVFPNDAMCATTSAGVPSVSKQTTINYINAAQQHKLQQQPPKYQKQQRQDQVNNQVSQHQLRKGGPASAGDSPVCTNRTIAYTNSYKSRDKTDSQMKGGSSKVIARNESCDDGCNGATKRSGPPILNLLVRPEEAYALELSISELTMRSSYASSRPEGDNNNTSNTSNLPKVPEHRRMAYYAVGKHHHNQRHNQSVKGGNRRCYFTGKLILNTSPFYAGCVQQGLRTLVVFCLPSALGLPAQQLIVTPSGNTSVIGDGSCTNNSGRIGSHSTKSTSSSMARGSFLKFVKIGTGNSGNGSRRTASGSVDDKTTRSKASNTSNNRPNLPLYLGQHNNKCKSSSVATTSQQSHGAASRRSRFTSSSSYLDESTLGLSIESDLDPNWSYDRDALLQILPPVSNELLQQLATSYPEQFETLPVQVRDYTKWKLYIKFCFFSGLPISRDELHYKVRDDLAEEVFGEEIILSHEIMVASVTASSAELLTLPNRTVIKYIRKHYSQQCAKLDDRIFERANWERVAPEV